MRKNLTPFQAHTLLYWGMVIDWLKSSRVTRLEVVLVIAVLVACLFSLAVATSEMCRQDQSSAACLITNGWLAEQVLGK